MKQVHTDNTAGSGTVSTTDTNAANERSEDYIFKLMTTGHIIVNKCLLPGVHGQISIIYCIMGLPGLLTKQWVFLSSSKKSTLQLKKCCKQLLTSGAVKNGMKHISDALPLTSHTADGCGPVVEEGLIYIPVFKDP